MKPRVLILVASGTNRDRDGAVACQEAGGEPEIVHINQLRQGERRLADYQMLFLPGGFSYGDDLGAGRVLATDLLYALGGRMLGAKLTHGLGDDLNTFAESGKPILGICNGFQALVKAGLLPGPAGQQQATLATNASNRFECRWVHLRPNPSSPCVFTQGLDELIYCPVAHGEGRFIPLTEDVRGRLHSEGLVALTYCDENGDPVGYPGNPNGSVDGIAGICNARGNVFGLMPHPEDHIFREQHPRWTRGEFGGSGLALFRNAIRYAAQV
ncbi:MAG: phosphoribosylformylglycinamidine synthase I [Anaerolineae bacterium]|jgi:phosphoribosylformylglycinamidine synthase